MTDGAVAARLRELAAEHALPGDAVETLERFLSVLARDDRAATTVRDPAEAVDRHVADALTGLVVPEVRSAGSIVDLGSGAGVPALPLAAALPDAAVTALDAVGRKVDWTTATASAIGLSNVAGVHARAEDWARVPREVDVVVARAVAPAAILLEYAAPLLRVGGVLVAWKGEMDPEEAAGGEAAALRLGLQGPEAHATRPWPGARDRRLLAWRKAAPTPPEFPRRAGMARKRPLGTVGVVRETPAGPVRSGHRG